jgi:hypothetical protein
MQALRFWKAVVLDETDMLESLVRLLEQEGVTYCVIGGQAVNAYVEPLVSMDLDVVIAVADLERIRPLLAKRFRVEAFPHSINLSLEGRSTGADPNPSPVRGLRRARGAPERSRAHDARREPRGRASGKSLGGIGPRETRQ